MPVTIAVDAMGGDHGPSVTIPASLAFLEEAPQARIIAVGTPERLEAALAHVRSSAKDRLVLKSAAEVVEMTESPAFALRSKKDSSMRIAINLVKDGTAHACVSAGNTGALMAISRFVLKTLPGIDRPAIASQLPTRQGVTTALDLGANVNCTAEQLLQFAIMGSALVSAVDGVERPSVGLLNIGEEEIKGNDVVKEAAELLKASGLNFYGNVEGTDIYKGTTDVIVCDGFVGNVALKISEGLVETVRYLLKQSLSATLTSQMGALLSRRAFADFKKRLDYSEYGGAPLLGVKGVTIITHGSANANAIKNALRVASEFATRGTNNAIEQELAKQIDRDSAVHA